ncbi:transglutaminase domain-containing protein [Algibacter aquimarinus]|uniref:Transglutaminase-like domain-containing protein n=1 Tax=Algibacter aquimarinus TaxID=1136748 RepID=A0ABP9HH66_9FLAO
MRQLVLILVLFLSFTIYAQKEDFSFINFDKADSIANSCKGYSLRNLPVLTYNITQDLDTQVEQFRAIYIWVCNNIESDYSFGESTLRHRKRMKNDSVSFSIWNAQVLPKVFKKLLNDKKTICSGYAYLIKEMSALVGINCEIVDGYSRTTSHNIGEIDIPNHSWNAVKLNSKWYLADATMASGYFDIDKNEFVKNYNDGYFLVSPELFLKKNYPLDLTWLLSENKTTLRQFVDAPIVYGSTFKHTVTPICPKILNTKITVNQEVVFKFKLKDETKIKNTRLVFSSGLKSKTINVTDLDINNGIVELKYRFTKKGSYDVHLMVGADFVITYTVKVEKVKKNLL